jgi:bifunctional DNase/RNase
MEFVEAQLEDVAIAGNQGEQQFLVLLKTTDEQVLPIVVGTLEAMSIVAGKNKEAIMRPLTHDLILSILEVLNAQIKRIEITDLKEHTYYAKLILERQGVEFEIDARPSDCLGLAARMNCTIYIAKHILEIAAQTEPNNTSGSLEA